ncbi:MAG: serine/threonine-protein kinase [Bacteroidota bacterium]
MALFDAVSTLPAAKRTAYLDKACADHPEWRRVLNAMLAEFDASTSAGGLWPRLRPALNVGDQVGRYRIVRELGEGGMGVVFLADDPRLDRVVAVKLIRLGRLATPGQIRRFSHEINILARLRHPAIATIYDAGATADGVPYFAMEYVEGQPLDVYANAQGLDVKERLRLLIAAAEAVQYAHQNLIIHRDLKPSNLLVEVGDKRPPRVKLLDFGIAKLLDDSSGQPGLTRTGERLFTPAYAAPEQLAGRPVSTATDVYALGVVLYELLTGTRPFSNDLHSDARQTLPHRPSMVLAQQAPPFRRAAQLRGDLDTIVLRALQPDPDRRYRSARELADDLRRHLEGLPVLAQPDTFCYRAGKFVRRHALPVATSLAALLAMVGFGAFYIIRVTQACDRAHATLTPTKWGPDVAAELIEWSDPHTAQGTARSMGELFGHVIDRLTAQPTVLVEMVNIVSSIYLELGLCDEAAVLFETPALTARGVKLDPGAVTALHHLSHAWGGLNRHASNAVRSCEADVQHVVGTERAQPITRVLMDTTYLDVAPDRDWYGHAVVQGSRSLGLYMQHALTGATALGRAVVQTLQTLLRPHLPPSGPPPGLHGLCLTQPPHPEGAHGLHEMIWPQLQQAALNTDSKAARGLPGLTTAPHRLDDPSWGDTLFILATEYICAAVCTQHPALGAMVQRWRELFRTLEGTNHANSVSGEAGDLAEAPHPADPCLLQLGRIIPDGYTPPAPVTDH